MSKSFRTTPYVFTSTQQLFSDIYLGILKQGRPCVKNHPNGRTYCSMRGETEDGTPTACAVGQLLTDDAVNRGGAGEASNPYAYSDYLSSCGVPQEAMALLESMQSCHDSANRKEGNEAFIADFKTRAADVAEFYNLIVPEIIVPSPKEPATAEPGFPPAPLPQAVNTTAPINLLPRTQKRKDGPKTKRYAASVFRRAAKLLADNPGKHVFGYGEPEAEQPSEQCFCAMAAIDVVLKADGHKLCDPELNMTLYPHYGSIAGENVLFEQASNIPVLFGQERCLWGINDRQPMSDERVGRYRVLTPEGSAKVVRVMRETAARLEHGGEKASPKKGGAEGVATDAE